MGHGHCISFQCFSFLFAFLLLLFVIILQTLFNFDLMVMLSYSSAGKCILGTLSPQNRKWDRLVGKWYFYFS